MTVQHTPPRAATGIVRAMPTRTWTLRLDDVLLPGPNELMRMHAQDYRRLRDELLLLARASLDPALPAAPLDACTVHVTLWRPARRLLDADAKYGAVKPLLDVLQPGRGYARKVGGRQVLDTTNGLALLRDDRDGEAGLKGCIRDLRVVQRLGDPAVEVRVDAHDEGTAA